ncbi:MAG: hypothetical protein A2381_17605 [Bdellovibrionales bacterium RIFOXYB1_FULL_37_110]|nr:MAG: hypothetical protein A2181_00730 [Bdellovibrionales bacterium RIFOXYA1_FULL_38_20]OFZ48007.1 MAG: hypothetical protein A2417_15580 [Bdellovibrionales bacterium RIFOXYC1_FULL_37_79]OFZ58024.1 MAG: hypothetical protein A2381_17605 [Bdellovibrionales bacterium RIFOXYB1_FULL_37_110]OFZ61682.1 MAG: hypothetical protein A2577_18180 [Bdellovibrionales bacterium RIFOXYD1_FULL_36_51]
MGLTQAAVSRQIRLLEEDLNIQLLIRSPQKVVLTPKGVAYFTLWNRFEKELEIEFGKKKKSLINLGAIEGIVNNWLIDRIQNLLNEKKYNFNIMIARTGDMVKMLEEGRLDGVISNNKIENGYLTSRKILKEEKVLISAHKITLPGTEREKLKMIQNQTWIFYASTDYLCQRKHSHQKYIQVNSFSAIMKLVECGAGIAIVPKHCLSSGYKFYTTSWSLSGTDIYFTTLNYHKLPIEISLLLEVM